MQKKIDGEKTSETAMNWEKPKSTRAVSHPGALESPL